MGIEYCVAARVDSIAARQKIWRAPFFRGILVLGQSLRIGIRALMIASNHATDEDEELTSTQIGKRRYRKRVIRRNPVGYLRIPVRVSSKVDGCH